MYTKGWNLEFLFRVIVWSSCLRVVVSKIQMPSSIEVQSGQTCSFPIESDSDDPESRIVCKFSADGTNFNQFYMSEFDEVSNGGFNFSDRLKVEKESPKKFKMTFTYVTKADQGWYFCVESNNENAFDSMHLIVTVTNCSNDSCLQLVSNSTTTSFNDTENIQTVRTLTSNSTATDGNGLSNEKRILIGLVASAIIIACIAVAVVVCTMVKLFKKKGRKEEDVESPFIENKDSGIGDTRPPTAAGNPD